MFRMPTAKTKASRKYNEKAYDRVSVMLPRGRKKDVEAFCSDQGQSVNGLVNGLLRGAMGLSEDEWKQTAQESGE